MSERHDNQSADELFDLFVKRTRALNGEVIQERKPWNTEVTADAIRHFCDGIGDANPFWLKEPHHTAPPAFLASVLYPVIHGAPMEIPLANLILDLEYRWYQPVIGGDRLKAVAHQKDAFERKRSDGSRSVFVISEIVYRNQRNECIAEAESTMMRLSQNINEDNPNMLIDRAIHKYAPDELEEIGKALCLEANTLTNIDQVRFGDEVEIGTDLPELVRGPLTLGDMICWQAAIGPSYRAGPAGYHDALATPHTLVRNPVTGWRVKNSQEHEDFLLASNRGMPAPFDNGVMRFATLSPLLTNWMGKRGFLRRLSIQILAPNIYGDTTWYQGTITNKIEETGRGSNKGYILHVAIRGTNQLGETNTLGEAEVFLPAKSLSDTPTFASKNLKPDDKIVDRYVHDLVEQQLLANPDQTALVSGGCKVSGGTLQRRINGLADRLRVLGVGPETIVGVCIDRSSPDLVAGLTAIVTVGGAYLPIESDLPQKRLEEMLEDAKLRVVITQKCHLSKFADSKQPDGFLEIILVDQNDKDHACINAEPRSSAEVSMLTSNHPAYLLYTSGITAQPKGVLVPHSSLSIYIQSLARALPVTGQDICLQTAMLSFSAASRQVWLPLYLGATLVVATKEEGTDPFVLFTLIKEQGVTVWDTVPSILNTVLRSLQRLDVKSRTELLDNDLRLIMVTGEALLWETIHAWRKTLGHDNTEIINLYSQTETAGTVCFYPIPKSTNQEGIVPLGKPIDNTKVYVLDNELCPVPDGESGEICVSGTRLSREYRGQKALTAERFVIPSDGDLAGIRLYRTRDRGRWRSDGVLEHQGRLDDQLKIRGHRISPAEIELVILTDAHVKEAAVSAVKGNMGENKLIAWVAPIETPSDLDNAYSIQNQHSLTETALRKSLEAKLPAYMIPSKFHFIKDLPRTLSGKVNRLALISSIPTEDSEQHSSAKSEIAMKTPIVNTTLETELIIIWQELLEKEQVRLDDDFFESGGDSLKAGELLTIVRGKYEVSVSLRDFFRNPSVAGLQETIEMNNDRAMTSREAQDKLQAKLRKLGDEH